MNTHLLPLELLDDSSGNLSEIRIGGDPFNGYAGRGKAPDWTGNLAECRIGSEKFNGYAGRVTVPDGVELREIRTREPDCISRKFILKLKDASTLRTGWLKILIPYSYPPNNLMVWAANARFPSEIYGLGGLRLFYGDVTYGTVIPAVTLIDKKRDIALTVCKAFGRTGGRLSFYFGTYHEEGMTVEFSELALEPGKEVELELLMCGHKGCWRPGLNWLINRYPEYFEPVNKEVWKHHGPFAITSPFTKEEALDRLPIRWSELHNHFPNYGNYAPEEPEWDSVVLHDYPELKEEIPGKISPARINAMIDQLHARGIKAMLYIQVSGDCFIPQGRPYVSLCFCSRVNGSPWGDHTGSPLRLVGLFPRYTLAKTPEFAKPLKFNHS